MVLLATISITCGQAWSKNTKFPQPSTSSAPDIQPLTLSWLDDPGSPKAEDPPLTLPGR